MDEEVNFKNLGISQREINALAKAGIKTIDDLYNLEHGTPISIKGFGFVAYHYLLVGLKQHGYTVPESWADAYMAERATLLRRAYLPFRKQIDWEFKP